MFAGARGEPCRGQYDGEQYKGARQQVTKGSAGENGAEKRHAFEPKEASSPKAEG
jgi:hypothetical protein